MSLKTLIHTALQAEAGPIINHFGLKALETRPFRVYGSPVLNLIVSGVGREAAHKAIEWITGRYAYKTIINIGLAGCSDTDVEKGSLFAVCGGPPGLPILPLQTVDAPIVRPQGDRGDKWEPKLYDMEAKVLSDMSPSVNVHILKIVSDYLDGFFPDKKKVHELVRNSLPLWDELADPYPAKIRQVFKESHVEKLTGDERAAIESAALHYRFSFQELKIITDIALDYLSWNLLPLSQRLHKRFPCRRDAYMAMVNDWNSEKNKPVNWSDFTGKQTATGKKILDEPKNRTGFGLCPAASENTRCCNLMTLDTVEGCGFDCTYCSIRYFYNSERIIFDRDFTEKLAGLNIKPDKDYHIGTGQSSDSLMWGNRNGILAALMDFAKRHPNVILELKTKSDNTEWLLTHPVPPNVIVTWSLNPQIVIDNEEHLTASLDKRLRAARHIADRGILIGFHFHPIIYMEGWENAYGGIADSLLESFNPEELAMVSLGTLTFIKPLIRQIRSHPEYSRILKMPLVDANGKLSYPLHIKRAMFRHVYKRLEPWFGKLFFYLCMEDSVLWPDVFGFDYRSNEEFEMDMINSYKKKIKERLQTLPSTRV